MRELSIETTELAKYQQSLLNELDLLRGKKLLVVGDLGLDEYIWGDVRRISPEAPVPVLEVKNQDHRIGLAGNVAQNIASLGGEAVLIGVVGQDEAASQLRALLTEAKVKSEHLIEDKTRPTTRKTRLVADQHHLIRVDYEQRRYLDNGCEQRLLEKVGALLPECDGMILEDYAKGVLSEGCVQQLIALGQEHNKKVMVDPAMGTPARFFKRAHLLTPNRNEAFELSGLNIDDLREQPDSVLEVGRALMDQLECENLVITRGKEGMSLFRKDEVVHLPTYARQVYDVTGAGDTVIATMGLSWVAGFDLVKSCILANFAAGVVVGTVGSVPCSLDELKTYIKSHQVD